MCPQKLANGMKLILWYNVTQDFQALGMLLSSLCYDTKVMWVEVWKTFELWSHSLVPCVMKRGLYWRFVQKLWDNMKGRNSSHSSLTYLNYTNQNKKTISIITTKFGTSNNHKLILNLSGLNLERHRPPLYNIHCSSPDRSDVLMALSQNYQKWEFKKSLVFHSQIETLGHHNFLQMYIMRWVKAIFCKTFENITFRCHIKLFNKTWMVVQMTL